jgi:hypothetical protein
VDPSSSYAWLRVAGPAGVGGSAPDLAHGELLPTAQAASLSRSLNSRHGRCRAPLRTKRGRKRDSPRRRLVQPKCARDDHAETQRLIVSTT